MGAGVASLDRSSKTVRLAEETADVEAAGQEGDNEQAAEIRAEVEKVFRLMDADGNGKLDESEFTRACSGLGGSFDQLSKDELVHFFKGADLDGDGLMDLQEFQKWILMAREHIDLFRLADTDGNGLIDLEEWLEVAADLPDMTAKQAKSIFRHADKNGDGFINLSEFIRWSQEPSRRGVRAWFRKKFRAVLAR